MDFKVWVILDGTNLQPEHSSRLPLACRSSKQPVGDWWDPIFTLQQLPWPSALGVPAPLPFPYPKDGENTAAWLGEELHPIPALSHVWSWHLLAVCSRTVDALGDLLCSLLHSLGIAVPLGIVGVSVGGENGGANCEPAEVGFGPWISCCHRELLSVQLCRNETSPLHSSHHHSWTWEVALPGLPSSLFPTLC